MTQIMTLVVPASLVYVSQVSGRGVDKGSGIGMPSDRFKVSGSINKCYQTKASFVYLMADPHQPKFETRLAETDKNGRFSIFVPARNFVSGFYYLQFGDTPDKSGFGGRRIELSGKSLDVGVVGDCDL